MPIPTSVLPELFLKIPKPNRAGSFRELFETLNVVVTQPSLIDRQPKPLILSALDAPGVTTDLCIEWMIRAGVYTAMQLCRRLNLIKLYEQTHNLTTNVFEDVFGVTINLDGKYFPSIW